MTIIETDQSREIKLTEIARGTFLLRYLSYRKSEDAALDLRSEDYIVSEINPEKTIFGLCDGVGSSFYGNLGSQILGEVLLSWLGKVSIPQNIDPVGSQTGIGWLNKLTEELTTELNNKTVFATSVIHKKEITSQNEMVRMAEITQRDDFGTQSNFACGIVWPASPALPKGLVLLFWLGNARLRLFNQNKDLTSLLGWGRDPDQLLEVWSSKDGVLGKVYAYVTDLSKISSIIAYSDGLENAEEHIRPGLDGAQLETLVKRSQAIKDDDATLVELTTNHKEVLGQADDIVMPLRRHMQQASSHTATPSPADPEIQKLRSALDALQKKYDDQVRKGTPAKGILIAAALFLMTICFFSGVIAVKIIIPIETATVTATPTRFRPPTRTFTSTVLPLAIDTATPSETPTGMPTNTPTDTATAPTETITPSPETPTLSAAQVTPSIPSDSPTPATTSP